jgi:nicotinamide phosphoribosyltransferase
MNTRDTLGFAAKGAWFEVEEIDWVTPEGTPVYKKVCYDIYKDPITDDGTKKSLKGLIMVDENHEVYTQCTWEQEAQGILQTIYENGQFHNQISLTQVREKLNNL